MTCPLCGGQHPEGTTWCPTLWAEIPPDEPPDEPIEPAVEPAVAQECPDDDAQVTCPGCGDQGHPGQECRQCGQTIPGGVVRTAPVAGQTATVLLPSGDRTPIPRGREVTIGRNSELPGIRQGLEPFDAVSRRHCYVTVDPTGASVTVRDPGSANHTWVGDDPTRLGDDEQRTVPLPVRLRLGQHLSITISGEPG